jgi:hypothetical protein
VGTGKVQRFRSTATRKAFYEGCIAEAEALADWYGTERARLRVKVNLYRHFIRRLDGDRK